MRHRGGLQPNPPQIDPNGNPFAPPPNPFMRALHQIFGPRQEANNEVGYRSVDQDGRFLERGEEFCREGNTRRANFQRNYVVTVSGAVVSPDQVRGQCLVCHGFEDDAVKFCAACGVAICRRCQHQFVNGTTTIILCAADHHLPPSLIDCRNVFRKLAQTGFPKFASVAGALSEFCSILGRTAFIRRAPDFYGIAPVIVYDQVGVPHKIRSFLSAIRFARLQAEAAIEGRASDQIRRVLIMDEAMAPSVYLCRENCASTSRWRKHLTRWSLTILSVCRFHRAHWTTPEIPSMVNCG
jgi:hypothetical protein